MNAKVRWYGSSRGVKKSAIERSHSFLVKLASVPGTMMIVWAKMIGITPAVISRIGMKVFWPWVIRPRPITFLGIWTGIRRAAIVIPTTAAVTATRITANSTILGSVRAPDFQN